MVGHFEVDGLFLGVVGLDVEGGGDSEGEVLVLGGLGEVGYHGGGDAGG